MNQIIKDTIYGLGTQKQICFLADIGGMNEEEKRFFQLAHEGKSDQVIMDEMNIGRRSYERVYSAVKAKLIIAVFYCVNHTME